MAFKLGKPPVIEVWIRATFQPVPEAEWSWSDATEFLETYADDLTVAEQLPEISPTAKPVEPGQLPKEIELRVSPRYRRRRTESRSRIIQVGQNELLVTYVRENGKDYPGFSQVLDSFSEAMMRYRELVGYSTIESVELHYVDLIVVPALFTPNQPSDLNDLFVGAPEPPELPFGKIGHAAWSLGFACPESDDFSQLSVQMQPPFSLDGRFRLDWHRTCLNLPADDLDEVAARLHSAHNYLKECFQAICKPRVWELFEPSP